MAGALREGLEAEHVVVERTGEGAFYRTITEAFDVILLDLGLPDRSGLEILSTIRNKKIRASVIVLTARDTIHDRVTGLDAGADDYLVKPFASAELLARDVWKETGRSTSLDNVIDVHVARLRRKIEPDESPRLIHTVRGVGFVFREGEA